jgi:hypothetical protein
MEKLLEKLMVATGKHCFVRFDPERKDHVFTVVVGNKDGGVRLGDTDDPARLIREYLQPNRFCCGHKIVYGCMCGQNWTCPRCGNGQGSAPCNCSNEQYKRLFILDTERE